MFFHSNYVRSNHKKMFVFLLYTIRSRLSWSLTQSRRFLRSHLYCFPVILVFETFHAILYLRFRVSRSCVRFRLPSSSNLFFLHSTPATSSHLLPFPPVPAPAPPTPPPFYWFVIDVHTKRSLGNIFKRKGLEVVTIFSDPVALYPIFIGFPPPSCFHFPTHPKTCVKTKKKSV